MYEHEKAVIEAVLFSCGDSVEAQRLCEITGLEPMFLELAINQLEDSYRQRNSGLSIIHLDGSYQMVTCAEHGEAVRKALTIKKNTPLSSAAYEVLAIIAYNQPVTKSFVEQIRGVDSSSIVNSLVTKGLIEEDGRLNLPGRPIAYRTTDNFLRSFSLESLEDLPKIHTGSAGQENPKEGQADES